ncbi:hypothetical protein CEQ90_01305 [Lewinellaceae bacterium SD302]|nr:hypothetical protein CEQ90_01305 [Lewinellaceae bacterium SD302]
MASPLLEPLIKNLSAHERNEVEIWLNCPLHNRREDVKALFAELIDSAGAADKFVKNRAVDARLTRSYLLDRIEAYLIWKQGAQPEDEQARDLALCQLYRQRGLSVHFNNRLNRFEKKEYCFQDATSLFNNYRFAALREARSSDRSRSYEEDFDLPDRLLLRALTAARLRQAAVSLAGAGFSGRELQLPLFKTYLDLVDEHPELLNEPGIALYYNICLYQLPALERPLLPYPQLIGLLTANINRFPAAEQSELLKLILNYAIRRLNQDTSRENVLAAFQLYDLGLREGLLLESNELSNFTFNNFIGIALRLGRIEAAQRCIDEYASLLAPKSASEVMALNQARLAYARGELREALFLLQQADYRDNVHLINARTLHLRIYYELGEIEPMLDLVRATKIQISRRQLGYHEPIILNNLKFMRKLAKLRSSDSRAANNLRKEIEQTQLLSEREWLLEKLNK